MQVKSQWWIYMQLRTGCITPIIPHPQAKNVTGVRLQCDSRWGPYSSQTLMSYKARMNWSQLGSSGIGHSGSIRAREPSISVKICGRKRSGCVQPRTIFYRIFLEDQITFTPTANIQVLLSIGHQAVHRRRSDSNGSVLIGYLCRQLHACGWVLSTMSPIQPSISSQSWSIGRNMGAVGGCSYSNLGANPGVLQVIFGQSEKLLERCTVCHIQPKSLWRVNELPKFSPAWNNCNI